MGLGNKGPLDPRDPLELGYPGLREPQGHRVNVVGEVIRDPLVPPVAQGWWLMVP